LMLTGVPGREASIQWVASMTMPTWLMVVGFVVEVWKMRSPGRRGCVVQSMWVPYVDCSALWWGRWIPIWAKAAVTSPEQS